MRTRVRASVGASVLALLAPFLVAVHTAPPAAAAPISSATYEFQVIRLTNVQRARYGLPALRQSTCVDRFAERWASYMARTHRFRHQSLWPILDRCRRTRAAENIAAGYSTPAAVVNAWMRSPGHKRNILDRRLRQIAVGAVRDREGTWWVVQDFSG